MTVSVAFAVFLQQPSFIFDSSRYGKRETAQNFNDLLSLMSTIPDDGI